MTAPAHLPTISRLIRHLRGASEAGLLPPQLCHEWHLAEGAVVCMRDLSGRGWTALLCPVDPTNPDNTGPALAEATDHDLIAALTALAAALPEPETRT